MDLHSNAREYVRPRLRERNKARYATKMVKFCYGGIMAWRCIKSEVKRKFVKVDGDLNSDNYIIIVYYDLIF